MTVPKTHYHETYWNKVWKAFKRHPLGYAALWVVVLFILMAIYAPFLASSKPIAIRYNGEWYFPLFRYLFYTGFYTKGIDLFFNILVFTFPLMLLGWYTLKKHPVLKEYFLVGVVLLQFLGFFYLFYFPIKDPASDPKLSMARQQALKEVPKNQQDWNFELKYMNSYAELNLLLQQQQMRAQQERIQPYTRDYAAIAKQRWLAQAVREKKAELMRNSQKVPSEKEVEELVLKSTSKEDLSNIEAPPTLLQQQQELDITRENEYRERLAKNPDNANVKTQLNTLLQKRKWLQEQEKLITFEIMPLVRPFHWEDDAGGQQALNAYVNWMELTRINRKDLVSALIFGTRISLVVGLASVAVAYLIGIPVGALAGYYGGTFDIVVSRLLEIWESMPVFFMLLMVVAMTQTKSVFLVIAVIGLFGWPSFSRYVRGEFFKQRNLPYVEACKALGFSDRRIMFLHLLPNAIPPLLTLMPFAVMGAITTEAGLSFLGLGEEGSSSWGVLMDEGRSAFPGESYLLWPPAILLTILLVAIALVGDALRDALDPKLSS